VQILILSDLHANLQALEAVLADAKGEYDQVVCCGDIVGYNPNPAEVLDWTRATCAAVVRGNHDKAVAGIDDIEWFNDVAKISALWTMSILSEGQLGFLRSLPIGPATLEHFHIWHGSPCDEDEYISAISEAAARFREFELPLAFFGHTHLQGGFFSKHGKVGIIPQVPPSERELHFALEPDILYMVNPGSVGQPRDRDPRAAYALYNPDTKLVTLRRKNYPVNRTAEVIKEAGLPDVLGFRLFMGS
jgi:predicted phosphodiesterase